MRLKKRKKAGRLRGSHTHARGFKKNARGSGHRGGFGMAGTGRHKKSLIINLYGNDYFGKDKALRRGTKRKRLKVINLYEIIQKEPSLEKEINLVGYKILSGGDLNKKLMIKASAASKSAIDKIKKAGGDIILG